MTQSKKWAKELNRHFSKEDIQMANKHMKNVQHQVLLDKCKLKLQYHLTSVRMAIGQKKKKLSLGLLGQERPCLLAWPSKEQFFDPNSDISFFLSFFYASLCKRVTN